MNAKMLVRSKREPLADVSNNYTNTEPIKRPSSSEGRKFKIAVEGNIASGKSTFLKRLESNPQVEVLAEPLEKWQDLGGDNLIHKMYEDPARWGYLFQNYVLLTMMDVHNAKQQVPFCVLERSAYSARYCFVENLYKSGLLNNMEYKCYVEWFDFLMQNCKPKLDLIVYLRATPEVCYSRLKARGRKEEETVSLDYLNDIHECYESWLGNGENQLYHGCSSVLVLDGEMDCYLNSNYHDELWMKVATKLKETSGKKSI
ncbi:Thymidine kinase 2, mitochondrial [Trichoplax sp. H2]|nr:Thymidine kinase 2, mitochondrial [Trichoplax sp. H2]|eukprot:RDD45293.1 Thymidine kinase 2, mitochondrial [Trichoplax sp. H2]